MADNFGINRPARREEHNNRGYNRDYHNKQMDKLALTYKGLDSYKKKPINLYEDPIEKERTLGHQGSLFTAIILLVIFSITTVLLIVRRSVTADY